jgi:hypothetical protein
MGLPPDSGERLAAEMTSKSATRCAGLGVLQGQDAVLRPKSKPAQGEARGHHENGLPFDHGPAFRTQSSRYSCRLRFTPPQADQQAF